MLHPSRFTLPASKRTPLTSFPFSFSSLLFPARHRTRQHNYFHSPLDIESNDQDMLFLGGEGGEDSKRRESEITFLIWINKLCLS